MPGVRIHYIILIFILTGCTDFLFEAGPENESIRFFGTANRDLGIDVLAGTGDNIYVLGSIQVDGLTCPAIYHLDSKGVQKTNPVIIQNEIDNAVIDFAMTSQNEFFILTNSLPEQNQGSSVVHLIKLDSRGIVVWQKDFVESNNISAREMLIQNDQIYVVGNVSSSAGTQEDGWLLILSMEGEIIKEVQYGGNLNDGLVSIVGLESDVILLGNTQSFDIGNKSGDIWLVRTDRSGNIKGYNTFGTSGADLALSMVKKEDSDTLYVLGRASKSLEQGFNTLVTSINPVSLSIGWQKIFEADYSLSPVSLYSDKNELVIVQNEEISSNFTQIGILKYNSVGVQKSHYILDGDIGITARKITGLNDDHFIVIGSNVFKGNSDIAFLKLNEDGTFH